ncbi:uncharacterized protein PAC_00275 [Phialocephala subalpina]|uniref:C2H2-type domain-containing protein n=1 Tax=Phialocephala subalpina TaxID=576137 RepID=A0A1L7WCA0_9HELO|nr:uncharacterized protein PAC_00275 [Phialocephala subalpina]
MAVNLDLRWPRRSPDELRAFYSIALNPDNNGIERPAHINESQIPLTRTSSCSGTVRGHSSSSVSIFSGHAPTASSATSVSDNKAIAALAPRTRYDETTGSLRLHQSRGLSVANVQRHARRTNSVPEGDGTDLVSHSELNQGLAVATKISIGGSILRPRGFRDRFQDNISSQHVEVDQSEEALIEPDVDEKFWLDTLQEHPYHSLEGKRKLGRVGMWGVRRRRRDLETGHSGKKRTTDHDTDVDVVQEELLEKDSPLSSDDETVHITDDDVEDVPLFMGSSKSTLGHFSSRDERSKSSRRTILLDLGVGSSLRSSLESHHFDVQSLVSSSASCLELSCCSDSDEMQEEKLRKATRESAGSPQHGRSALYYCLFCFDQFRNKEDWEEHEYSQHIGMQKDWICMPWGAVEKVENGDRICVFCGVVDPEPSHLSHHNHEPCYHGSVSRRTFGRMEDLQKHLREVHDQRTMTERMEDWSFPPEEDDWYWQCGFCARFLVGWTDRVRHIGRHFRRGLPMTCWDPFVSPCPIDRSTGMVVAWSPPVHMDRKRSLAIQSEQSEFIIRTSTAAEQLPCDYCTAVFHDEMDAKRHEKLWHLPRDVWVCPTKSDARTATHFQSGPLASYLFPNAPISSVPKADICPYCGEYSEDIFYQLDEDIDECFADWDVRIEHLELEHKFDKCPPDLIFFRPDQFLQHLVGSHNLKLSKWTKEVMDSCKRKKLVSPNLSIDDVGDAISL